ncbi:MAG: hypothetical protein GF355_17850 [Candidatus Eisenbacteria bacterium]|nr:hypothetical protein [Candidatus Eisenbacteria bacterium]
MQRMTRSVFVAAGVLMMLAAGCSSVGKGSSGRLMNTEVVFVTFGSNNGEVAPCG